MVEEVGVVWYVGFFCEYVGIFYGFVGRNVLRKRKIMLVFKFWKRNLFYELI